MLNLTAVAGTTPILRQVELGSTTFNIEFSFRPNRNNFPLIESCRFIRRLNDR